MPGTRISRSCFGAARAQPEKFRIVPAAVMIISPERLALPEPPLARRRVRPLGPVVSPAPEPRRLPPVAAVRLD